MAGKKNFDEIFEHIGGMGPWQIRILLLIGFLEFFLGMYNNSILFLQYTPQHFCDPRQYNGSSLLLQATHDSVNHSAKSLNKCYIHNQSEPLNKCQRWIYEMDVMTHTVVTEWDLVCDNSHHIASLHLATTLGWLIGYTFAGFISDRYGRKKVIVIFTLLGTVFGIAQSFAETFAVFLVLRFLASILLIPAWQSNYVMSIEVVGEKYRKWVGALFYTVAAMGYLGVCGVSALLPNWKHINLCSFVPLSAVVFYPWLLPESPRWLAATNRLEEAQTVTIQAAKTNRANINRDTFNISEYLVHSKTEETKCSSEKLKQPDTHRRHQCFTLACRVALLSFVWFCSQLVLYGLRISVHSFAGGLFINNLISALLELPANLILIALLLWGRKSSLMATVSISGLCVLAIPLIPTSMISLQTVLVQTGKFSATITSAAIYVYTAELYPTVCRNSLQSLSNMFARLGSILAPYLVFSTSDIISSSALFIFGSFSLAALVALIFLPETKDRPMPEHISDIERHPSFWVQRSENKTAKPLMKEETEENKVLMSTTVALL